MKQTTHEWVDKAEGDWDVALRESQTPSPVWDAVCFHAQQYAEKYLKSLLEERGVAFSKTHDLVVLLHQIFPPISSLNSLEADLAYLSPLGVVIRYPGLTADDSMAAGALDGARQARSILRLALALP
jgi:HEPN domain-containing protein